MTNRQYMYIHLDILKPSIKTNGVHWEKLWFKIVYPFNDYNIITTSNYTQLQLIELPGYSSKILLKVVLNTITRKEVCTRP